MAITRLGAAERGGHSTRAHGGCQPSPPALRPGYLGSDKRERVVSEDRSQSSTAHTSGYLGRGCWVVSRMSNAEIDSSVSIVSCAAGLGAPERSAAPLFPIAIV